MTNHFWLIPAAVLCLCSMAWFALSLNIHWRQVYGRGHCAHPTALRGLASGALLLAALCCLEADHPSMAILVWVLLIPLGAISVALVLARRPHWMTWLGKPFV